MNAFSIVDVCPVSRLTFVPNNQIKLSSTIVICKHALINNGISWINRHNMIGKMLADVDPLGPIAKDGSSGANTGKIDSNHIIEIIKTKQYKSE